MIDRRRKKCAADTSQDMCQLTPLRSVSQILSSKKKTSQGSEEKSWILAPPPNTPAGGLEKSDIDKAHEKTSDKKQLEPEKVAEIRQTGTTERGSSEQKKSGPALVIQKPAIKLLAVRPGKQKYLAPVTESLKADAEVLKDQLENLNLPSDDLVKFAHELKPLIEKLFKKYTKTEYDVGKKVPVVDELDLTVIGHDSEVKTEELERELNLYRLQNSPLTNKDLLAQSEEKLERLGLILKNIQAIRQNITSSASKSANSIYSMMFKRLDRHSSDNGPDSKFESSVKDISSIHTIRAKHSISTLNYLCNSMISMSTVAIGQYADDKRKVDLQAIAIQSGFENRQAYETVLEEYDDI